MLLCEFRHATTNMDCNSHSENTTLSVETQGSNFNDNSGKKGTQIRMPFQFHAHIELRKSE